MLTYQKGDFVVHGNQVGKIVDIVARDGQDYYKVSAINDETLFLYTPIKEVGSRLRPIISTKDADELIEEMLSIEPIDINSRTAETTYEKLAKSGNHKDIIRLLKTSYLRCEAQRSAGKARNERDKTSLRTAERLLYSELSVALGKSYEETKRYVIDRVSKMDELNLEAPKVA